MKVCPAVPVNGGPQSVVVLLLAQFVSPRCDSRFRSQEQYSQPVDMSTSLLRRQMKNIVHNFSEAEIKVREATSNDPWGPSSSLMSDISDLTYNVVAFSEIMSMVWKRLNDQGKNWRHVYKALVLLECMIKTGSDRVAQQCRENICAIQILKEFQYIDKDGKDQGVNVREKAKHIVTLLTDENKLQEERTLALKTKEKMAQTTNTTSSAPTVGLGSGRGGGLLEGGLSLLSSLTQNSGGGIKLDQESKKSTDEDDAQMRARSKVKEQPSLMEQGAVDPWVQDGTSTAPLTNSDPWGGDGNSSAPPSSSDPWGESGTSAALSASLDPWQDAGMSTAPPTSSDPWGGNGTSTALPNTSDPWGGDGTSTTPAANSDPWGGKGTSTPLPSASDLWGGDGSSSALSTRADPWDTGDMEPGQISATDKQGGDKAQCSVPFDMTSLGTALPDKKPPESFLGSNAALVDLDPFMSSEHKSKETHPPSSSTSSTTNTFMQPQSKEG
ncbi:epsin-1-like [Arapaima gigas]